MPQQFSNPIPQQLVQNPVHYVNQMPTQQGHVAMQGPQRGFNEGIMQNPILFNYQNQFPNGQNQQIDMRNQQQQQQIQQLQQPIQQLQYNQQQHNQQQQQIHQRPLHSMLMGTEVQSLMTNSEKPMLQSSINIQLNSLVHNTGPSPAARIKEISDPMKVTTSEIRGSPVHIWDSQGLPFASLAQNVDQS